MRDAMALDNGLAALAVERKRHRQDGLERIALRAPCRRNISLAGRNPRGEIENVSNRLRRQAGTIVGNSNPILRNNDFDNGRNSSLLSGVEGIVDQLLQDNKRPVPGSMAGLIDKLFLRAKFRKPRCFEDAAAHSYARVLDNATRRRPGALAVRPENAYCRRFFALKPIRRYLATGRIRLRGNIGV
jgi:hypothetical protein